MRRRGQKKKKVNGELSSLILPYRQVKTTSRLLSFKPPKKARTYHMIQIKRRERQVDVATSVRDELCLIQGRVSSNSWARGIGCHSGKLIREEDKEGSADCLFVSSICKQLKLWKRNDQQYEPQTRRNSTRTSFLRKQSEPKQAVPS